MKSENNLTFLAFIAVLATVFTVGASTPISGQILNESIQPWLTYLLFAGISTLIIAGTVTATKRNLLKTICQKVDSRIDKFSHYKHSACKRLILNETINEEERTIF
jgi:hypothetical protein